MAWLDIKGTNIADTVYSDEVLVAKDVSFTLPSVTPVAGEAQAMGTMEVIAVGLIEAMEATITKVGTDLGLSRLMRLEKQNIEFRWVHNVSSSDGTSKPEGCKAFIRGVPKSLPAIGVEFGANSENEIAFAVTRYLLYVGGTEILLVDRLSQILRINGVDYYGKINGLL